VRVTVGVDLVQVSQVAASLVSLGERYTTRVYTPGEIAHCAAEPALAPARFAGRFAAKEAALKALRLVDEGLDLREIELVQQPGGFCELALHGRAGELARAAGWHSWSVSLSHDGDYATAVVAVMVDP
jgi:holo-[acyl-carrier protein] synthase